MKRIVLTEQNFSRLKEFVKSNQGHEIVFTSRDDELNRKVAEKLSVQIIVVPLLGRLDYTKQRNSGFNEVVAKIFKKKGIKLGIDLDELFLSTYPERILSRMRQNIQLCSRLRVQVVFVYDAKKIDSVDVKALALVLGMPTWMIKQL